MRETVTKIALTPAVLLVTAEVHELPTATYGGLMGAPSMGQFYNANIKGSGSDGPYDAGPIGCRATNCSDACGFAGASVRAALGGILRGTNNSRCC